jgi:hypothetical protein
VGSIQCGRPTFPVPGIVSTDVHERLEVGGFRALVGRDVTSVGFVVPSIGVIQDLSRPVSPTDAVAAVTPLRGLVGFTVKGVGAT